MLIPIEFVLKACPELSLDFCKTDVSWSNAYSRETHSCNNYFTDDYDSPCVAGSVRLHRMKLVSGFSNWDILTVMDGLWAN
jgi:hypothetical protein